MEHSDHGSSGVFKGIFLWLGTAIGIFGAGVTAYTMAGFLDPGFAGKDVFTDGLILGILLIVLGVGFGVFAVMIGREGWDAPGA